MINQGNAAGSSLRDMSRRCPAKPGRGRLRPCLTRSSSSASMTSARSIWSRSGPKFWLTGPRSAPRPVQYSMSLAACGWSGWVFPERVESQLCFERVADCSGLDEADQALGEVRVLRPGSQPDGQPPGGEVIDGAVPAHYGRPRRLGQGHRPAAAPGRHCRRRTAPPPPRSAVRAAAVGRARAGHPGPAR